MQARNDIAAILSSIDDLLPRLKQDALTVYLQELTSWNPQLGLVSKRATPTVIGRLVRRSADLWDFFTGHADRRPRHIVDIGSGGGFPGLIWKLLAPDLPLTLVERKNRRTFFLQRVVDRLSLTGVEVVTADLATFAHHASRHNAFDLAVVLAVAPPQTLGADIETLLEPGGYLVSARSPEEVVAPRLATSLQLHAQATVSDGTFLLYEKR
jgi:16S rRNA (guanine527-N7)-methyltransferase